MDIFSILKKEHEEIQELLHTGEELTEHAKKGRRELLQRFERVLLPHAKGEERTLYVHIGKTKESRDKMLEATQEHHVAELLLKELDALHTDDEAWKAKWTVLRESIEHHIHEEQDDLFKQAKAELSKEEIEEITQAYLVEKKKIRDQMK